MIETQVLIVGGGPAGSSCAWKLEKNGIDCLILDKKIFPREKLCAGWITPQVMDDLEFTEKEYPYSFTSFKTFIVHLPNKTIKVNVNQYAIRRVEFDDWLLKRSAVEVINHEVKEIHKEHDTYFIDGAFRCNYLVGAGGTHCPVYHSFFKWQQPRAKEKQIVTLEQEFQYDYRDEDCHLWFFNNDLPGYSWYVPKNKGYVNIGIGGFAKQIKDQKFHIQDYWSKFLEQLSTLNLIKEYKFKTKGYSYFIRDDIKNFQTERIYLTGDAAGLATKDMGEGIGPAIQSGILAAEAIIKNRPYSIDSVKKNSFAKYQLISKLTAAYFKSFF